MAWDIDWRAWGLRLAIAAFTFALVYQSTRHLRYEVQGVGGDAAAVWVVDRWNGEACFVHVSGKQSCTEVGG